MSPGRRAACLWLAGLVPLFAVSYSIANYLASQQLVVANMAMEWERHIPFLHWTIVPYWSLNLLYLLAFFTASSLGAVHVLGIRLLFVQLLAVGCFLAFPLRSAFLALPEPGITGALFTLLHTFDQPFNQAPSLHVAVAVVLWVHFACHWRSSVMRLVLAAWMLLIILSTLTTFQHHSLDVVTGLVLGGLATWVAPATERAVISPRLAMRYGLGAVLCLAVVQAAALYWNPMLAFAHWVSVSLLLAAVCYGWTGAPGFFKRADGGYSLLSRWLLAPYRVLAHWNRVFFLRGRPARNEVLPGLWLGCLPVGREQTQELRHFDVLDLSAEFAVRGQVFRSYTCVPMLDLVLPDQEQLLLASRCLDRYWARKQLEEQGHILVACGLGRGRSAAVLYYWLRHGALALGAQRAWALLQQARPEVALTAEQRQVLDAGAVPPMAAGHRLLAACLRLASGIRIEGREHLTYSSSSCVFYANHSSHADAALVWASLPAAIRAKTRPVAAADYWLQSRLKSVVSQTVFQSLLIERQDLRAGSDALAPMRQALASGQNLLLFPEGTRKYNEGDLARFKPGLYFLARSIPDLQLVPVYLQDVQNVLPKSAVLPVPFQCAVFFGEPIGLRAEEDREAFLARAQFALASMRQRGE